MATSQQIRIEKKKWASITKKWIDALRSGNYSGPTSVELRAVDNTYSLFGVLCDLIDPSKWSLPTHQTFYLYEFGNEDQQKWMFHFPNELFEKMGFSHDAYLVLQSMVIKKHPFSEVADFLERVLKERKFKREQRDQAKVD